MYGIPEPCKWVVRSITKSEEPLGWQVKWSQVQHIGHTVSKEWRCNHGYPVYIWKTGETVCMHVPLLAI